jgi:hypothetical protein
VAPLESVALVVVLYLARLVGAASLVADHNAGRYVAAVTSVAALALMISGAWLLFVRITMREPDAPDRSPKLPNGMRSARSRPPGSA